MASCRALLVSATSSGQGKTLVTAALACAYRKQGLRVRAFKCGPDFLDPTILETATGAPVMNLDLALCGEADGRARLYSAAQEVDVILVEGVMGLCDGQPSTADIAARFGLPVVLIVDASAMAQTFGAIAGGLQAYRPDLHFFGAIANRVSGAGHAALLSASLPRDFTWLGYLPPADAFALPERHLGLYPAAEIADLELRLDAAAHALTAEKPLPLPPEVEFPISNIPSVEYLLAGKTIAIGRDAAFRFLHPANLDCLTDLGAKLEFFSPLYDAELPPADAVWLPGGYPELYQAALADNSTMHAALSAHHAAGKPLLAECGGMMALAQNIDNAPAIGLLSGKITMQPRLQGLGMQKVSLPEGTINGHTFHYSSFDTSLTPLCHATTGSGKTGEAIYRDKQLTASYLHFYFPSNPVATAKLFLGEAA